MKVRERLSRFLSGPCDDCHFADDVAYQFRRERVAQATANTLGMSASNICFSTVTAWWFWGRGADLALGVWCAVMVLLNAYAFYRRATRDKNRPASGSYRAFRSITGQAVTIAGLYGVAPFILIPISSGSDAAIVAGMAASSLTIGPYIFHSIPSASRAWILTSVFFNSFGFLSSGQIGFYISAFFGCLLGVGVWQASHTQSRRLTADFMARQTLKEKQGVISLLLQEHEENSNAWVWQCNAAGEFDRVADQLKDIIYGDDYQGRPDFNLFDLAAQNLDAECVGSDLRIADYLGRPRSLHDLTFLIESRSSQHEDARQRWISLRGKPVFDGQERFVGYHGIISDVTETKLAEDKIRFLAGHDALTGLANRITFGEGLQPWIDDERAFASLHIDLDRFKLVNDTLGHLAGDELLIAVSNKLKSLAHDASPEAIVARIGGDEFVLAFPLEDVDADKEVDDEVVEDLSKRIVEEFNKPFELEAGMATIGTSVGYVIYPDDAENPSDIPARADLALYRAKKGGRGRFARYEAGMDRRAHHRKRIEMDLKNALRKDQFSLVYQPVVDLENGVTTGVEALLRWNHPELGLIGPEQFIPMAEEGGSIVDIGGWVLNEACVEAATWDSDMSIAVNVSAKQILREDFVPMVLGTLASTKLPPSRLELELTESILVQDSDRALETIRRLRKLGVSVVLDDFGTGYSSLSYLRDFAFDKIKIDKSFITTLDEPDASDPQGAATLVTAIVNLAQTLGMRTTAEGIELESQADELRNMGCDIGQGYLFARPVPAAELKAIIGLKSKGTEEKRESA